MQYAAAFTVVVMLVVGVVSMVLEINIVPFVLNGTIEVPVLVVSYLLAPYFGKFIKRS